MMTRILEGFRASGAAPVQSSFGEWPADACGMRVLHPAVEPLKGQSCARYHAVSGLSLAFVDGFIDGWDELNLDLLPADEQSQHRNELAYREGYAYGSLCWLAAIDDFDEGRTRPLRHPKSARQVAVERAALRGSLTADDLIFVSTPCEAGRT